MSTVKMQMFYVEYFKGEEKCNEETFYIDNMDMAMSSTKRKCKENGYDGFSIKQIMGSVTLSELYKNEGWKPETKIYLMDKRSGKFIKIGKAEELISRYGNKKEND